MQSFCLPSKKPYSESAANLGEVSGQQELPSASFTQRKACVRRRMVELLAAVPKAQDE